MASQPVIEKKPRSRALDNIVTRFLKKKVVTRFLRNKAVIGFLRKFVVTLFLKKAVRAHFARLAKLPTWGFILAVGAWTVLFKAALSPIAVFLNTLIFAPLGLDDVFSHEPILELADMLTASTYDLLPVTWGTLFTMSLILISGVLLPLVATFLAQVVPQHLMAKLVRTERRRAVIAAVAMGFIYMFCYGEVAFFVSGSVIAIPLVFTFFHRMSTATLTNAFVITAGIHAVANTIIVLFRGLFGGE